MAFYQNFAQLACQDLAHSLDWAELTSFALNWQLSNWQLLAAVLPIATIFGGFLKALHQITGIHEDLRFGCFSLKKLARPYGYGET